MQRAKGAGKGLAGYERHTLDPACSALVPPTEFVTARLRMFRVHAYDEHSAASRG